MDAAQVIQLLQRVPPDDSVLEWALRKNVPWATLKALIEHYCCDPSAQRASAFMTACRLGNNGAVRLFLAAHKLLPRLTHIEPGMDDNYALRLARKCEHDDVILTLISLPGVDARIDEHELLVYAVSKDNVNLVRALVQWKRTVSVETTAAAAATAVQFVNPYANDALAVHTAIARNTIEIVRLVLLDWRPPFGDVYTPRTSLQQTILQTAASSAYVHDCLDTRWKQSPRTDTYTTSPRAFIVSYYENNEDEDENDVIIVTKNPLGKSTARLPVTLQ